MRRSRTILTLLALILVSTVTIAGCAPKPTPAPVPTQAPTKAPAKPTEVPTNAPLPTGLSGSITEAGSTTVQPLAEKLAEAFTAKHPNVDITVQGGGSSTGVKSAGQNTVDVGAASREVKDSEKETYPNLKIFTIARDGIAIVAHPDVPISGMTKDQAKDIFAGIITNWKDVGGPDKPILVVAREEGSGTRAAFEEMVMGKKGPPIVDTAILQPSNGAVRTTVATTPDSIGFLSFGYLDDSVKALEIDGVAATEANASSGAYPIVRPLNMLTGGAPSLLAKAWLDFILSEEGQAIVTKEGYLSVLNKPAPAPQPTAAAKSLSGSITEAGSTTVQPLAEKLAEAFTAKHPNVDITVQGGGSSTGVKSAGQNTVDVGAASREVKDSEKETYPNLKIFTIARDGIAIVAHPDVPISGMTKDQAKDIFAGIITNWKDVGGPDKPILVVAREEGSGTRAAFEEMVMGKEGPPIVDTAILQPSNGAVRTTVATTPDSIGFLSFGYLDDSVKALEIDGVAATEANASSGAYPIVRPLNMLTGGAPSLLAKAWLDFILSEEGQAIVTKEGYLSVLNKPAPAPQPTAAAKSLSGSITEAGSTTVQPLAEKLAEAFTAKHPNVDITVQGGGSSTGVKSAGQNTVDVGAASREVKDSEKETYPNLKIFTIARDGIAIVAHPNVPISGMTKDQAKDIFAGIITNWKDVGGPDKPILVVAREEGSGTRAAFEEMVMGKEGPPIVDTAILQPSNGAVRTTVATTPDSIGFLSFGYLDDSVKAIEIDGVAATEANASSGAYPIVRPLNMLTGGEPSPLAKAWLDFILSEEGQSVVVEEGYIPIR